MRIIRLVPSDVGDLSDTAVWASDGRFTEAQIIRAHEEIAILLSAAVTLHSAARFRELRGLSRAMQHICRGIGLDSLARVAGDLEGLAQGHDATAMAAVLSRLRRLSEAAIFAIPARIDWPI